MTFLAHESGIEAHGVRWDQRTLSNGEGTRIDAETLLWHLTFHEGETLRDLGGWPALPPFSALLVALQADREGVAAQHEARRRRWKLRRRACSQTTSTSTAAPGPRIAAQSRPSPRHALTRFIAVAPVWSAPKQRSAHDEAATAVYMAFGTVADDDAGGFGRFEGTLFANRYIHYWLLRHRHLPPERLIDILAAAVETARARGVGVVLPELSSGDVVADPDITGAD